MKKLLLVMIGLVLTLSMSLGLLYGCAGGATPKTTATTTAPTTTTPGATTTAPAKTTTSPPPTKAGEVFKLKCQSGSAAGVATWPTLLETFAMMKKASGGRLDIELLPAGAIVGTADIFDAVRTGAVDCAIGGSGQWLGKDMRLGFNYLTIGTFTFNETVIYLFADACNGMANQRKVWGDYNTYYIPLSLGSPEHFAVARTKPITKLGDSKGLKYRGYGWANLVMAEPEFGCSATFLPGQELYSALQTGILDWCEYDAPNLNWSYGLYEVCKYDMYPGIHEMTRDSGLLFPMKQWEKFPDDLKALIEMCCAWNMLRNYAKQMWDSADLTRPGGKIEGAGVKISILTPEFQEKYNEVSNRLAEAEAAKDPRVKAIWEDQKKVFAMIRPYMKLQTPSFSVK